MARSVVLPALFLGVASWSSSIVSASKEDPIPVYRAYDGPSRPAESVALLFAPSDFWVRTIDERALADIRNGVFFELPAGTRSLRAWFRNPAGSSSKLGGFEPGPYSFELEGGKTYRLRWAEDRIKVRIGHADVAHAEVEPHSEPLPALARMDDPPCWYDAFNAEVVSFVWGKTMRERLKQTPKLTLKQPGSDEPRTWNFSSLGVFQRPAGRMQEMASNWNADGTFHGYLIGTKPLVAGRRVRALVSTCHPDEIREVILE